MAGLRPEELQRHFWRAARMLRDAIDADCRHHVFGLLLFKRISDVLEEEKAFRAAAYGSGEPAGFSQALGFQIPKDCSWSEVLRHSGNIGTRLRLALQGVEDRNPALNGIFSGLDFDNRERFPDSTLQSLLLHIDQVDLSSSKTDAGSLGAAIELLLDQFADDARSRGDVFSTPPQVARLVAEILQPEEGMSIYDGACGAGAMLLECANYVKRQNKNHRSLRLYGQENDPTTWAVCRINMLAHDRDDVLIAIGDTLRDPRHLTGDGKALMTFDRVISEPPFNVRDWGFEEWSRGDVYGRIDYGVPPRLFADFAFLEHFISSLNGKGMLGAVLPTAVLFRGRSEAQIRKRIIQADLIEAVIGLGPNLLYGSPAPACLVIVNKAKSRERREKTLFVDASEECLKGTTRNTLSDDNVQRIAAAFHAFRNEDRFARVASQGEIEANDYSLSIPRYVQTSQEESAIDVAAEWRSLLKLISERNAAEDKLSEHIRRLCIIPDDDS